MLFYILYNKINEIKSKKDGGIIAYMKKRIIAIFMLIMCLFGSMAIYATAPSNEVDLTTDSTIKLVKIKEKELKTLQDYQAAYGNDTYGLAAYILNGIRIYSIPFGLVGIAISGIYRYIIGIRKLDVRDKGFGTMIGIITVMVICQVLPLVFAIVVKGWRG